MAEKALERAARAAVAAARTAAEEVAAAALPAAQTPAQILVARARAAARYVAKAAAEAVRLGAVNGAPVLPPAGGLHLAPGPRRAPQPPPGAGGGAVTHFDFDVLPSPPL